jgi:uncharacterized protein
MKRAVILHGTDGSPQANWFPWLKQKLEEQGYEVWVPELPNNHTPNRQVYNDFLFNCDWDLSDNIIIGHSSGAVEVLNLLTDDRCPHIRLGVMAGVWATMDGADKERMQSVGLDPEQFRDTFPPKGFDFERIRSKADRLAFLHGDNDPYCPLEQAKWLAEQLQSPLTVVSNGHHLGARFTELPEVLKIIEENT